ncbi:trans-aconitate 2-methyltransferase [Hoeflea marina]|uniref:Trans-aconitate 2-methyltransferase n=1 Tax=Hoeflea marina TaxID=274592 RepID=A0A317PEG1_9HYPH|nr:trans-aconitate 2-methyltransferase [Hoeflea marina]PWV95279.1 trans-aconitate 2-methyltransferase [Hoeflea marina]
MADWSAEQYLKFADERTRPARDLLARVALEAPRLVVDIGCGPGNSTELITERWPTAEVTGIDTSPAMLADARKRLPGSRFELADARDWRPPEGADLLFANAIYQWLPDHASVMQAQFQLLGPGAVMAVQMPDNLDQPTHMLMSETAAAMPFAEKLAGVAREKLPPAGFYHQLFSPFASSVDVWRTTYHHPMTDAAAIVEWVRSTGLRPFLDPLDDAEQRQFLDAYERQIAAAYPALADGTLLLPFPRLFMVAVIPDQSAARCRDACRCGRANRQGRRGSSAWACHIAVI